MKDTDTLYIEKTIYTPNNCMKFDKLSAARNLRDNIRYLVALDPQIHETSENWRR
ncbi:hypothetical protein D3C74_25470 [compost metagenome]